MLAEALEAEVEAYVEAAREEREERGRALVVRNGHARKREVVCGAGALSRFAPRGAAIAGWTRTAKGGASRA